MAAKPKVIVTGIKEVDRALKQLPALVGRKVLRGALKEAMAPIKSGVETRAPKRTGYLVSTTKMTSSTRRGTVSVKVQIGESDKESPKAGEAAAQELGYHKGKRGNPGRPHIEGQHFMLRTYRTEADRVRDQAIALILEGIAATVKELRSGTA